LHQAFGESSLQLAEHYWFLPELAQLNKLDKTGGDKKPARILSQNHLFQNHPIIPEELRLLKNHGKSNQIFRAQNQVGLECKGGISVFCIKT
jgi:hypothetical protein